LGVRNPVTASEADIVSFEQKYDVTLAAIVRDYFTLLNGTTGGKLGMDDENLIGFWHIDQVRPLAEECPEYATGEEPNLFVFADYSIWAHAYALRLIKGQDSATPILLIGVITRCRLRPLLRISSGDMPHTMKVCCFRGSTRRCPSGLPHDGANHYEAAQPQPCRQGQRWPNDSRAVGCDRN